MMVLWVAFSCFQNVFNGSIKLKYIDRRGSVDLPLKMKEAADHRHTGAPVGVTKDQGSSL